MKIVCNGEIKEVRQGISIEELLKDLDLNPETVVVECDQQIVLREEYEGRILHEGAVLELIRFVGGG